MSVETLPTFCALCVSKCGSISVFERDVFVRQEADPSHPTGKALCIKGRAAQEIVNNPQRLLFPLRRTSPKGSNDPKWVQITWDEALNEIVDQLARIRTCHGPKAVAFSVTSPSGAPISDSYRWIQRFVNVFGSPNLLSSIEVCNWHKDFSHGYTFGRGIGSPDFLASEVIVLWGHNPSVTWLDHATQIATARSKGAQIVVVDPRKSGFASQAKEWLRVRPGCDGILAMSIANELLKAEAFNIDFVRRYTNGPLLVRHDTGRLLRRAEISPMFCDEKYDFVGVDGDGSLRFPSGRSAEGEEPLSLEWTGFVDGIEGKIRCSTAFTLYREACKKYDAAVVESITSVPASQVRALARILSNSAAVSYYTWSGISQHNNASHTDRAIALLFALTGSFDAPGGNVTYTKHQTADVSGVEYVADKLFAECLSSSSFPMGPPRIGRVSADALYSGILDHKPYRVRALVGFGANLLTGHPQVNRSRAALESLEFYAHCDVVMTPTAMLADIVLPVNTPWEREGLQVGFEGSQESEELIQLRQQVVPSKGMSRSDTWIVFELAQRLGHRAEFWNGDIEAANDHFLSPTGITMAELRKSPSGIRRSLRTRYKKYISEGFATLSGRIEIYSEALLLAGYSALPDFQAQASACRVDDATHPLILTSSKIVHFCHSQHRGIPSLRRRMPEPEASLHPETATERDIMQGEWMIIQTQNGSIRMRARFDDSLDPRVVVAQYGWWSDDLSKNDARSNYNSLIGNKYIDPISGTPSLRSVSCDVRSEGRVKQAWREFRLIQIIPEAANVSSLYLLPVDREPLFTFAPGQFVSVEVTLADGQVFQRSYSISSSTFEEQLRISVHAAGTVSRALSTPGAINDVIKVKGPYGQFTPNPGDQRRLVMVCGGIGVTPFLSILRDKTIRRPIDLYYSVRNADDIAFLNEIQTALSARDDFRAFLFVTGNVPDRKFDRIGVRRGRIDIGALRDNSTVIDADIMICGSIPMVDSIKQGLIASGVSAAHIFSESFGKSEVVGAAPRMVHLVRSQKSFQWTPNGPSLLDLIEREGVAIASGCRVGQCGACSTKIAGGLVVGADSSGCCLPCIHVPQTDVYFDI